MSTKDAIDPRHYAAHLSHCNQGEYVGVCAYGFYAECPALINQPQIVREFSAIGPCLKLGRLVRETARFYVFNPWVSGDTYESREKRISKRTATHYSGAHIEPCKRCEDHSETHYPHGYMD